jgi:hypothetical protein
MRGSCLIKSSFTLMNSTLLSLIAVTHHAGGGVSVDSASAHLHYPDDLAQSKYHADAS